MSRRLVVGPIAEREIEASARWYEAQQSQLGSVFVDAVLRALELIEAAPETFPKLGERYRRKLLDRFPYAIIYKVTVTRIYVRAVAHCRRRPGYWDR